MYMINCILLVLLLPVSMVPLKYAIFLLVFLFSFPKLRPIVSSISTFNYDLVGFLCDLFSSVVPHYNSCKYTFSFVSQIKNANLSGKFPVSYDVTSFFTNIPAQETIDTTINLIFNHDANHDLFSF